MRSPSPATTVVLCCCMAACEDPRGDCAKVQDPERAIRACTVVINSGRESKHIVALALYNRGVAENNSGDYDKAIADLSSSASLISDNARTYYNRALAYFSKGETDSAIADLTKAVDL